MQDLIESGNIDRIKEVVQPHIIVCGGVRYCFVDYAVKCGKFEVVKWLHENGYRGGCRTIDYAGNDIKLIRWLHSHDYKQQYAMRDAAMRGDFELVKWFHNNGFRGIQVFDMAAKSGNFKLVKWLYGQGHRSDDPMEILSWASTLEIIKWLYHEAGYNSDDRLSELVSSCANDGNLQVIMWAYPRIENLQHSICIGNMCMRIAVRSGHFEIVKWFQTKGRICNDHSICDAVPSKNLDMIKWLYEQGYESPETMKKAIEAAKKMKDAPHIAEWLEGVGQ